MNFIKYYIILALTFGLLTSSCGPDEPDKPQAKVIPKVTKSNDTKLYMHYMPWYHSKEFSGYWGSHWRMSNKNPEVTLSNGQRQIASHYYPLIGPYDSADPNVIDYHLLLMKYAGVDGILIDWYGTHDVLDYKSNFINSNAIIAGAKRVGLEFGIVYEEFTAEEVERRLDLTDVEAAQADLNYMDKNYFSSPNYIKKDGEDLLLTFGPRYFKSKDQWSEILSVTDDKPCFMPLWGHKHRVGDVNASGEFAWVDFKANLSELDNFYSKNPVDDLIGSAYPGFHDFYKEGGWGDSYGFIDHGNGETFDNTLTKAKDYELDIIQLVTWNDFGEGTIIEPTVEFEYRYLEKIQGFAEVEYGVSELEIIYEYYDKRRIYKNDTSIQEKLDLVLDHLIQLKLEEAKELLSTI